MHSSLISSIRATMNERSHETDEHSERMIHLSVAVGKNLQLSAEQLFELDLLSRLHDIGKISIEEYILSKPGQLTTNEWSKVKLHPEVGCRIAQSSPDLIGIAYYILCHHERWDGNGYPQNLSGENIPLLSRIISIVDSYDAMTQDRPYRKAMSKNEAIAEIKVQSGSQFDPTLARIFVEDVLGLLWE
jgi:HD-GYP domain-containing protein (c-di-GMP phosphodiesterase class II)